MENNTIFTRIQLKYDSYTNWATNNPTLLEGEVAIAKLVTTNAVAPGETDTQAPVLFKVGPGAFNSLPWVSGLAADVYAWAKKETPDWTDFPALPLEVIDNDPGKFVTDFTYADNKLTITRSDVAWTDIKDAPDFALKSELPTALGVMSVEKTDATAIEVNNTDAANPKVGLKIAATQGDNVTVTQSNDGLKVEVDTGVHAVGIATGSENGRVKLTVDGVDTEADVAGLQSAAYVTVDSLNTTAKGYADAVEAKKRSFL